MATLPYNVVIRLLEFAGPEGSAAGSQSVWEVKYKSVVYRVTGRDMPVVTLERTGWFSRSQLRINGMDACSFPHYKISGSMRGSQTDDCDDCGRPASTIKYFFYGTLVGLFVTCVALADADRNNTSVRTTTVPSSPHGPTVHVTVAAK